jgi:Glycosyl hydrolases family 16
MLRIGVISRAHPLSTLLVIFAAASTLVIGVHVAAARAEPLPNGVPGNWALIFNEEFSANGLNTSLWTPEWPGETMNGQCTSPALVQQPGNGYLYLQVKAQTSTCGGTNHPDTGSTAESNPADGKPGHTGFLYSYGYVEWRVYIVGWGGVEQGCPKGGCIPDWPGLWSFPENEETEIDTMEGLKGEACYHFHRHVYPEYQVGGCAPDTTSYAGWHTYGVDWEPGVLKWYYDGTKVWEYSSSDIKSTPQYLIMTEVPPGSYGGHLVVPDEIVVDYVRVWQHPGPPTVSTGAASALAPTQATLNGTVNPNGADTHYYFQYGTTTSYGSATGEVDAGSGWGAVAASATIGGLEPGSVYHYRLVAQNSIGTSYGNDSTLTTPSPPEASTSAALGVQETRATLNGTVNPKGYDGYSATYRFEYGTTSSYGSSTPEGNAGSGTSAVSESYTLSGLIPGQVYHYRLVATNAFGTAYGSGVEVKTYGVTAGFAETLSAVAQENGNVDVFGRLSNGDLGHLWFTSGYWNGPQDLGAEVVSGTSTVLAGGHVHVFWKGTDGNLWTGISESPGQWSGAQNLGDGTLSSAPHAIGQSNGTIDVFWGGGDGQLYHDYTGGGGVWHGWQALGGELASEPSPVLIGSGHYAVFWKGTEGNLREGKWEGGAWEGNINRGSGPLGPPPVAASAENGNINVFWGANTQSGVWSDWYTPTNGWAGPEKLGS